MSRFLHPAQSPSPKSPLPRAGNCGGEAWPGSVGKRGKWGVGRHTPPKRRQSSSAKGMLLHHFVRIDAMTVMRLSGYPVAGDVIGREGKGGRGGQPHFSAA